MKFLMHWIALSKKRDAGGKVRWLASGAKIKVFCGVAL